MLESGRQAGRSGKGGLSGSVIVRKTRRLGGQSRTMGNDVSHQFFNNAQVCFYSALLNLLENKPYSAISVTELAAAAGKDRTIFYRYFECKEDLLVRCLHVFLDSAVNSIKIPERWTRDTVSDLSRILFGIIERNERALGILLGLNSPVLAKEAISRSINEFWNKALQNFIGPYPRDESVLHFSEFLGCCVMASIEFWMGHRDAPARSVMENDLCCVILNGMNTFTDRSEENHMIPVEYPSAWATANAV